MESEGNSTSVVIADDDANICTALRFLLEAQGYDVRCAADGEEAIREVHSLAPAVLLLDLEMPKRSGYEVCQTLRDDPELANMRILIVSAKCQDVAVEKALAMGADGYLAKPFSMADVIEKVGTLVKQGQLKHA